VISRNAQAAIQRLAEADATARPLPSPCLTRWRTTGAAIGTTLWRAAAWEASALERPTIEGRTNDYARAREIVAVARGEIAA